MDSTRSELRVFDRPATYRIAVLGSLDADWSSCLEGMTIVATRQPDGTMVSTLEGELRDQAALLGVLVTLFERHRAVLSVRRAGFGVT